MNMCIEPNRRQNRLRLAVFALGLMVSLLVVFVGWRVQSVVAQATDPYGFADMGRSISEGHGFRFRDVVTVRRAPLYPALIALLYTLGGPNPSLVQIAQSVLLGLICVLALEIGRRVFTERSGLIAAVLCALHPMLFRYVPDIQVEIPLAFLFLAAIWRSVVFAERPTVRNGLLFGVVSALAALVKGVVVLYPGVFVVYWLCHTIRHKAQQESAVQGGSARPAWGVGAAIFIAMGLVILPWTLRNYRVTQGHFVLISSNAGGEFLRGYVFTQPNYFLLRQRPYVEGENAANQMEIDLFAAQGKVWEQNEAETEAVLNRAAKQKFLAAPFAFVRKFVLGLFMFWYVVTNRLNSLVVGALALAAWTLALIGWRRARQEGRASWLLFLPIFTTNIMYATLLALGRYSAVCIPPLMVLAAYGIETLLPQRRS